MPPQAPKNTAFANFVTHFNRFNPNNNNSPHISFNVRNGNWLESELTEDDIQFTDCSAFCSNAEITGSDTICSLETYSVTNEATTVNWSITEGSNLVNTLLFGDAFVVEPKSSNSSGYVTISVNYSNSTCGNATGVTKRVWVGKPTVANYGINGGSANVFTNDVSYLSVSPAPGATSYYWWITPTGGCSSGSGPTINNMNPYTSTATSVMVNWGDCPGTYSVVCRAQNACGEISTGQKFVTVDDPNSDPCNNFSLRVSPNPNKGNKKIDVTINRLPNPDPCPTLRGSAPKYQVEIYDFNGAQKYSGSFKSENIILDGLKLKKGVYILTVTNTNGNIKSEKLVID